ncbi:hypothetical protein V6N11_060410 [Hibiscus sabdariffa]|uniref:Uncharacterized protein n=1 Tax=Hibiscus sabdariffa TaxID=183260 RepID=A0ABR2QQ83_9ROSI
MREKIPNFSLPHNLHRLPSKSWPPPRRGIHCLHRHDRRIILSSATASTHDERLSFIGKVPLKLTDTSLELNVNPRIQSCPSLTEIYC